MSETNEDSVQQIVLLPCPFCGSTELNGPHIIEYVGDYCSPSWWVDCENCPCSMHIMGTDVNVLADAWNTRVVGGNKVIFHWERPRVVAPTAAWIVLHSGYMYGPCEQWEDVERIVREEWQHDRNLVG